MYVCVYTYIYIYTMPSQPKLTVHNKCTQLWSKMVCSCFLKTRLAGCGYHKTTRKKYLLLIHLYSLTLFISTYVMSVDRKIDEYGRILNATIMLICSNFFLEVPRSL